MDMTATALIHALRGILPDGTGLGHAGFAEPAPLCAADRLGPATPARAQEFAAGRLALRRAMQAIGLPAQNVPRAADRGPFWPNGILGAITHAGGHALAIVARTSDHGGLGLDLVAPADWPAPDLWPLFLHPEEYAQACPSDAALGLAAKEATIKLLRDATGQTHDFLDLTVTLLPDRTGFSVRVKPSHPGPHRIAPVRGKLRRAAGHILALCATAPENHARRSVAR